MFLFVRRHVRTEIQKQFRNVDLHRTNFRARPAKAGCKRKPWIFSHTMELRRDDGANRTRVHPRITVAANLAVNRTVIQACATADAIERLPPVRIGQQLGPAIVDQDQIELFRPIHLALAPRTGQE